MLLDGLNKEQLEAVTLKKGPLLIIAGAGSGKTKTLTTRISYHIKEKNYLPSQVLAITFTNKAANEMKSRIQKELSSDAMDMWIGTFHSVALRVLRKYYSHIGYKKNFIIYDRVDQLSLIKQIRDDLYLNFNEKEILAHISEKKSLMLEEKDYHKFISHSYLNAYLEYQKRLRLNNAMDFDSILILFYKLLKYNKDILKKYRDRFKEVLVDEYQDTNRVQYNIVKILTKNKGNIVAVGDDNQSIYGWRGADITNILSFKKDFKDSKVIKLEQNYRSTSTILNAANSVISNNSSIYKKNLWSTNDSGKKVTIFDSDTDINEAKFISEETLKLDKDLNVAVLYRNHALSRLVEKEFVKEGIDYQVIGGLKFYERKEVKDIIAYLRLIVNRYDDIAFLRVINTPTRGLGKKSIEGIMEYAVKNELSYFDALKKMYENNMFSFKQSNEIKRFIQMVEYDNDFSVEAVNMVIEKSGYIKRLEQKKTEENESRIQNIAELVNDIYEFNENYSQSLNEYLQRISLVTDSDNVDGDKKVTLMSLHSSKGLEYDVVFLLGLDEEIFPSYRSLKDESKLEEERRLCYVGITRAKKILFITRSRFRNYFGRYSSYERSRFLDEIPAEYLNEISNENVKKKYIFKDKQKEVEKIKGNLSVGKKVFHKIFGKGTIVEVKGDFVIKVAFKDKGIKELSTKYAPLEVLNE